mmetsp:Transcript_38908/g.63038  ORF Transcript_38908/g.63038 Transcript_38908/m.63038 type:complete len:265 (+) Transcript_38908:389-1183(+)
MVGQNWKPIFIPHCGNGLMKRTLESNTSSHTTTAVESSSTSKVARIPSKSKACTSLPNCNAGSLLANITTRDALSTPARRRSSRNTADPSIRYTKGNSCRTEVMCWGRRGCITTMGIRHASMGPITLIRTLFVMISSHAPGLSPLPLACTEVPITSPDVTTSTKFLTLNGTCSTIPLGGRMVAPRSITGGCGGGLISFWGGDMYSPDRNKASTTVEDRTIAELPPLKAIPLGVTPALGRSSSTLSRNVESSMTVPSNARSTDDS